MATTTASTVLITGNTYPVKDQIKALGGRWDAPAKGWRVPASKADQARELVSGTPRSDRSAPTSVSGETAILAQHWSQRGRGPAVRLCAGGCGRRVGPRYAECYGCHRESIDAM